jgi:hypothetical protein
MKRILRIIFSAFIICIIPFSMVAGQEKKIEKKIKIVVADGSGTEIVIDTLLKDGTMNDSIKLKDGMVVFVGDEADLGNRDCHKHVFVTVSDDGKNTRKEVKEITIVISDSVTWQEAGDDGNIYVYSDSKAPEGKTRGHNKVVTWSEKDGNWQGEKVIIIKDGKVIDREGGESFTYTIQTDSMESDVERTKYVIAKDGMVISIEGNDDAKVKELIKEIENKLGVKSKGAEKK